jgi:hypothetical protein
MDWLTLVPYIFGFLAISCVGWVASSIKEMSTSIKELTASVAALNANVAVVVVRVEDHHRRT